MNRLLDNGQLQEMTCGSNFAYVLNDNGLFLPTEYKVLQSQTDGGFVKCMKMSYNGHIALYYMHNGLKPLSNMLGKMDTDSFLIVVTNLFADIIETRSNGFLSCQNVELAFDKVFVDPNTLKVSLIYLPLSVHLFDDYAAYESQLRSNLIKLINGISSLSSSRTIKLASDLSNGMLSLDDLYNRLKGGKIDSIPMITPDSVLSPVDSKLRLVAMNAPTRVEIEMTKDSFVLGKNASMVDGPISFNKMISRVHCRISKNGNQYTITDLQSANGTFVNRVRLQPNQSHPIKNGDIVRLANSDFQILITNRGTV